MAALGDFMIGAVSSHNSDGLPGHLLTTGWERMGVWFRNMERIAMGKQLWSWDFSV